MDKLNSPTTFICKIKYKEVADRPTDLICIYRAPMGGKVSLPIREVLYFKRVRDVKDDPKNVTMDGQKNWEYKLKSLPSQEEVECKSL